MKIMPARPAPPENKVPAVPLPTPAPPPPYKPAVAVTFAFAPPPAPPPLPTVLEISKPALPLPDCAPRVEAPPPPPPLEPLPLGAVPPPVPPKLLPPAPAAVVVALPPADAENNLEGMNKAEFAVQLCRVAGKDWPNGIGGGSFTHVHTTAAQRAEAFLRTIEKWEGE